MKKAISLIICIIMITLSLSACGGADESKVYDGTAKSGDNSGVVVDLTKLSSTMVYSEVNQIVTAPADYIGKTIKMSGICALYYNQSNPDMTYYSCIIKDATACCSQGLEFVLKDGISYPELDAEITVRGIFLSYDEDGTTFYHIANAELL